MPAWYCLRGLPERVPGRHGDAGTAGIRHDAGGEATPELRAEVVAGLTFRALRGPVLGAAGFRQCPERCRAVRALSKEFVFVCASFLEVFHSIIFCSNLTKCELFDRNC